LKLNQRSNFNKNYFQYNCLQKKSLINFNKIFITLKYLKMIVQHSLNCAKMNVQLVKKKWYSKRKRYPITRLPLQLFNLCQWHLLLISIIIIVVVVVVIPFLIPFRIKIFFSVSSVFLFHWLLLLSSFLSFSSLSLEVNFHFFKWNSEKLSSWVTHREASILTSFVQHKEKYKNEQFMKKRKILMILYDNLTCM